MDDKWCIESWRNKLPAWKSLYYWSKRDSWEDLSRAKLFDSEKLAIEHILKHGISGRPIIYAVKTPKDIERDKVCTIINKIEDAKNEKKPLFCQNCNATDTTKHRSGIYTKIYTGPCGDSFCYASCDMASCRPISATICDKCLKEISK